MKSGIRLSKGEKRARMMAKKDPMIFFTCLKQIKNKKLGVMFMRAEIERGTERVPHSRDTKVFKIVKLNFDTFDDVIECIEKQQGGEYEHFYCNVSQTQWGRPYPCRQNKRSHPVTGLACHLCNSRGRVCRRVYRGIHAARRTCADREVHLP